MFKPVRVVATFIFLGSIVLVFVGAFVIGSDVSFSPLSHRGNYSSQHSTFPMSRFYASVRSSSCPTNTTSLANPDSSLSFLFMSRHTVFVIIEYLAYTWYTLSYIPYARSAVLKVFGM